MSRRWTILLALGSALVVLFGAYDLSQAVLVRCTAVDDRQRVVTLADLDLLWARTPFEIENADGRRTDAIALTGGKAASAVILTTDAERHCTPAAVFASIDDSATVRAHIDRRVALGLDRYRLIIPNGDLHPGLNVARFRVVACDLSGYYAIPSSLAIDVRSSARQTNAKMHVPPPEPNASSIN